MKTKKTEIAIISLLTVLFLFTSTNTMLWLTIGALYFATLTIYTAYKFGKDFYGYALQKFYRKH